ncbi:MAG: hypothetical protein ACI9FN_000633 [Saprospiraceae bacterium]|jgi:hypothetical protein
MNDLRTKIWNEFNDAKVNEHYSNLIAKRYQKWDLGTNIFLVIMTSSSIAAWAIWEESQLLWGVLIAFSQIITITKPYFLFPRYIKTFHEKGLRWKQASMRYEVLWYEFNHQYIDEEDAKNKFFSLKEVSIEFDHVPDDIIFFDFNKQLSQAEEMSDIYMKKN